MPPRRGREQTNGSTGGKRQQARQAPTCTVQEEGASQETDTEVLPIHWGPTLVARVRPSFSGNGNAGLSQRDALGTGLQMPLVLALGTPETFRWGYGCSWSLPTAEEGADPVNLRF